MWSEEAGGVKLRGNFFLLLDETKRCFLSAD